MKNVKDEITSCTQSSVELHVTHLFIVSAAEPRLPLQIDDASRPAKPEAKDSEESSLSVVNLDTRLDNRFVHNDHNSCKYCIESVFVIIDITCFISSSFEALFIKSAGPAYANKSCYFPYPGWCL